MELGPVTRIPAHMIRPDVVVCFGEDRREWDRACRAAGLPLGEHEYRRVHAGANEHVLTVLAPFGSPAVEALLWELFEEGDIERMVLVGTAGSLGGYAGPIMEAVVASPARQVFTSIDDPREHTCAWPTGLPEAACITTDRFYGMSTTDIPCEQGLVHAWQEWRDADAIIDMESAAFYDCCRRFGPPELQCAAIRVVANEAANLAELPERSAAALEVAAKAAASLLG